MFSFQNKTRVFKIWFSIQDFIAIKISYRSTSVLKNRMTSGYIPFKAAITQNFSELFIFWCLFTLNFLCNFNIFGFNSLE